MTRALKNRLKRTLLHVHRAGLRFGVVILPNHYYTGVPDILELRKKREVWARKSQLLGLNCDLDGQAQRLKEICLPYEPEYRGNPAYRRGSAAGYGPGFGYIEAQALYAVVRHLRPARIVEVGSGVSTYCMLEAIERNRANGGRATEVVSIEPYPSAWLRQAGVRLIAQPVQEVQFEHFDALEAGDLLFIDSSHTVKTGGDVNFIVLEVLARLRPGVVVQFHDVYLPYDYSRDALQTIHQSQETALLHAFLIGNNAVRILFCLSQLHYERREVMHEVFPEYRPQGDHDGLCDGEQRPFEQVAEHFPSSIYLEITG